MNNNRHKIIIIPILFLIIILSNCNIDNVPSDFLLPINAFTNDKESTVGSSTTAGNPSVDDEILPSHLNYSRILVYAEDDEGFTPVIGFNQSVPERYLIDNDGDGYSDDYLVAVSNDDLEIHNQTNICNLSSVQCCQLHMLDESSEQDVEFECYYQSQSINKPVNIYITDGNRISQNIQDISNPDFLWLRQEPKDQSDLSSDDDNDHIFATLGQDRLLQYYYKQGKFKVLGNYHENYSTLDANNSEQIAFDKYNTLTFRNPTDGIDVYESLYNGDYVNLDFLFTDTKPDTLEYSVLKQTEYYSLRYARNPISPLPIGNIYSVESDNDIITFLYNNYDLDNIHLIEYKKTIAFDIDSEGYAIVLFSDSNKNLRLSLAKGSNEAAEIYSVENKIEGDYDFIDLVIFEQNLSYTHPGKAIFLDKENSDVWIALFNHKLGGQKYVALDRKIHLGNNFEPNDIVLNNDKTKAYIVNQNNDSIAIIDLMSLESKPTIQYVKLEDFIPSKKLIIEPNSILFREIEGKEYLIVGLKKLRSNFVINLDNI